MKVLFVASGNGKVNGVSSFILSQYKSLESAGVDMQMFPVDGHGLGGYLANVKKLRKTIKAFKPDIVHAHYSLCGFLSSIACIGLQQKIYCSIMGGFPKVGIKHVRIKRWLVRFFANHIWDGTLAKSQISADQFGGRDVKIVPNGINLQQFNTEDKQEARKKLGLDLEKKYIIFPTFPKRYQKNYPLAESAIRLVMRDLSIDEPEKRLSDGKIEFRVLYDMLHDDIVRWMCAADITLMTSRWEGSPNVIKEAMAVNCPVVSTVCGDVPWLIEGVEGCYLVTNNTPEAVAEAIRKAIAFAEGTPENPDGRTNGRQKIYSLHLSAQEVAQKLIELYKKVL